MDNAARTIHVVVARRTLGDVLAPYVPGSGEEAEDLATARRLLDGDDEAWDRSTALHATGSALIVHPPTRRVLLRWHERQQAWIQVGGHADPGEHDPYEIARREAVEETGLADLVPWPGPDAAVVQLVVVQVPANEREPAHEHLDVRFVLATSDPDAVVAESDAAPLRWLTVDEAMQLTAEANVRELLARVEVLFDSAADSG